jgi:putative transposase
MNLGNRDGRDGRASLYLQGVGDIVLSKKAVSQLRRLLARGGEPRTLTITKTKSDAWRACVGFRGVRAKPLADNHEVGGVDRGIYVTAALPDGTLLPCPQFLGQARNQTAELQREREAFPKHSSEWKKRNKAIAKTYAKAHNRSENWARHTAIDIVARFGVISLEDLKLVHMTKSARGTVQSPGEGVAAKKGLNRSLQDAALGRLSFWICVKAEEAGRRVWKVNPRNSSRECAACGHTEIANRRRTQFRCINCSHTEHADVNASQVIAARGQEADALWRASGSPTLKRPVPRNQRHRQTKHPLRTIGSAKAEQFGAGSAPHASIAQLCGMDCDRP